MSEVRILGISCFYHDSAAALIVDGKIIAAAQEERFTRKKHDSGFPSNAIRFCLDYHGTAIHDLTSIVFYDKPLLKFERLLETYYSFAPKGVRSFIMAMPVWIREKLFLKRVLKQELKKLGEFDFGKVKLLFTEHHLSHSASAYFASPFDESAILTIDGVGEWATASISRGTGNEIKVLKELDFPHSLGLLYSAFTYYLGFKVNSGEYKLMGLAPYGNPQSDQVRRFRDLILTTLTDLKDDGSIWLDQSYFNYATGLTMAHDKKWNALFGFPKRCPESELEQHHCDLALAIQQVTEQVVLRMAQESIRLTGSKNLCLAGGVALNCVANGKLQNAGLAENLFIQPAAGDAGGALGAALAVYHIYYQKPRGHRESDLMQGSYLGPEFPEADIERDLRKYRAVLRKVDDFDSLCEQVAQLLADGNVIGWFQGRMEFGPRALGNRSILGDPRNPEMQKKLNLKIKFREGFRPFAPAVLFEDRETYFDLKSSSPYMLLVQEVKANLRKNVPQDYPFWPLRDKLYFQRSTLPSITHVDYSARIQTVHRETNLSFWTLIDKFRQITGVSVIVNTSFNVRSEPIVCTPEDAYKCLMRTDMDYLVIGNYLLSKRDQPEWSETVNWKEEYVMD